jgi:hypothetical protein
MSNSNDFAQYSDLESYLFREVSRAFSAHKRLSAFDFFCIVIWKANRAKSRVARRLLAHGHDNLESAVTDLLAAIENAHGNKERLRTLIETWGFRLPMASAILTVLFPDDFTVYDVRVCEVLGDFKDVQYKTQFDALWESYSGYVTKVREAAPEISGLRDKDRYLWGKSFASQLQKDIAARFDNGQEDSELEV